MLCLLLVGCATTPSPTNADGRPTGGLRVGQEQTVPGTSAHVSFTLVDGDSRCPTDVTCVWAGNAVAVLGVRAESGPTNSYRLNTTLDPRQVQPAGQPFEIRLDSLRPLPHSGQAIQQSQYVAYLSILTRPPQ